jgi:hypothetical protein
MDRCNTTPEADLDHHPDGVIFEGCSAIGIGQNVIDLYSLLKWFATYDTTCGALGTPPPT